MRFLPSTVVIIVMGPIAGRLSDRIGPEPLMTAGLIAVAGVAVLAGPPDADTNYASLVGAFVLLGIGMGLVMSPMSTAAMNAVDQAKAGVASGILTMSRMVGGTFGVAVMGALIAAPGPQPHRRAAAQSVRRDTRQALTDSLGAGGARVGGDVGRAVQDAYVHALNYGPAHRVAGRAARRALTWWLIADRARERAPPRTAVRRGARARGRLR